ncbi:polysaccharide pyruvyl transferase family protein [Elizabethkingia anophelis]|nr:polysaccharide pyruvyl transferase family protein [Elizabethkingia anophelis]
MKLKVGEIKHILFPHQEVLSAVGSIMGWLPKNSKIWGSGFMRSSDSFKGGDVLAVRGQLTNDHLQSKGFEKCDVYGDPALLLPLWIPRVEKKEFSLGVIPHWGDVKFFTEQYGHLYKIIDSRTRDISSFVREVHKCEYILSSSLHGLIVSHAYNIPALWIKRGEVGSLNGFKFKDYFSSVSIPFYDGFENLDELFYDGKWADLFKNNPSLMGINCSLEALQKGLLRVAPFRLKDKYLDLIKS